MANKNAKSINLLDPIYAPDDIWDRLYHWVFNVGKYLLIGVQILVLVVFAARFVIDRQNNDLTEEINNRVDTLSNDFFRNSEAQFVNLHNLLDDLDLNQTGQPINSKIISSVLDALPVSITMDSYSYSRDRVSMSFTAPDFKSISDYERKLQTNPSVSDLSIRISKSGSELDSIDFTVSFKINSQQTPPLES